METVKRRTINNVATGLYLVPLTRSMEIRFAETTARRKSLAKPVG